MDPRVHIIASYLQESCERVVSLRDLSQLVNLSESHLSHLFRRQTGMSPQRYLKVARMYRASQLLGTTFLSVKEVMAKVGYNDPSHFVREFEKMMGESPSKYRQHHFRTPTSFTAFANEKQKAPMGADCNPRKRTA
jgi:AraC family transcriptional regulator of arabinose operon